MRIAVARINQETHSLSPVPTELSDFQAMHHYVGDALMSRLSYWNTEVEGAFRNAELSGFAQRVKKRSTRAAPIEVVPLVSAWAAPSGPLSIACYETLLAELLLYLEQAGPIDAVYLSLHGAMGVTGLVLPHSSSPDGEIVARVRNAVGPNVPIAVSLDLHANLCAGIVDNATVVQAYQTNPHRDHAAVGARCADWLIDIVRKQIDPVMEWRSLPMILGGGNTVDFVAPMRPIFARMRAVEKEPGMLGASVLMCHPWNNHPELGWAVLVVACRNKQNARDVHADALAEMCWAVRDDQPPPFISASDAVAKARAARLQRKLGVVVMADVSDVVSAGAPGENVQLVAALLAAPDLASLSAVRDPALVDELHRAGQSNVKRSVKLGGKLDPTMGIALDAEVLIERLGQAPKHGRYAILRVGAARVVVLEGPALVMKPSFYEDIGLRIWPADVVMVKNFFPFLLFFLPYARKVLFVRTKGRTDLDEALHVQYAGPVHPQTKLSEWRSGDRRRRHQTAGAPL
jgi:microcystin degradation protein MlrC